MADRIALNVPRFKGDYEFDIEADPLTALEWRWIKKVSGYLPLTLSDGLAAGDPDVMVAFAVVALYRAGRIGKDQALAVADELAEFPFDGVAISLIVGDEEEQPELPPGEPAKERATNEQSSITGGSGKATSDQSGSAPKRIGAPV